MSAEVTVHHDPAASRFHTCVDGHEAELEYQRVGNVLVITHTGVPAAIGGRGVAAALTKAALQYVRAQELKVDPACAYAAAYMQRHTEYADLLQ